MLQISAFRQITSIFSSFAGQQNMLNGILYILHYMSFWEREAEKFAREGLLLAMNLYANPSLAMDFHLAANVIPFFVSELLLPQLLNDFFVLAL